MAKKKQPPVVFTAGYGDGASKGAKREPASRDSPQELAALVRDLKIDRLLDCRAYPGPATEADIDRTGRQPMQITPGGKRIIYCRKGWWRVDLAALLGAKYEWAGDTLGGPTVKGGVIVAGPTELGMARLVKRAKAGERLLLMCQEGRPADCHRHLMLAVDGLAEEERAAAGYRIPKPLTERGVDVWHAVPGIRLPRGGVCDPLLLEARSVEAHRRDKKQEPVHRTLAAVVAELG